MPARRCTRIAGTRRLRSRKQPEPPEPPERPERTPASGGRSTFLPQSPTHTSLRVIGQNCHVVLPAAPEGVKGGLGFSNRGRTARDCRVRPAAPRPLLVATPALPSHHPLSSRPLVDSESATSSPPRPPGDPDPGAVPSPPQAPASPSCSEASGRLPRGLMLGQQALLPRGPSLAVSLKARICVSFLLSQISGLKPESYLFSLFPRPVSDP